MDESHTNSEYLKKTFYLCREIARLPDTVHKLHLAPQGLYHLMYDYEDLIII